MPGIIWSASLIGDSHNKSNVPNQDYRLGRHYAWGDIIVVADGVGSCRLSQIGSKAACHATLEAVNRCIISGVTDIERIINLIHATWLVNLKDIPVAEAHCTCLFAFTHGQKLFVASVGDGLIGVSGIDNEPTLIYEEDKTNSFSNCTEALGYKCEDSQWNYAILEKKKYQAVILCTDGIANAYSEKAKNDFVDSLVRVLPKLPYNKRRKKIYNFLEKNIAPVSSDDKTLIGLYWG